MRIPHPWLEGVTFEMPHLISDGCLDSLASVWEVQLNHQRRDVVRYRVYLQFNLAVQWHPHQDQQLRKLLMKSRASRKKVGRKARELLNAIEDGGIHLNVALIKEETYINLDLLVRDIKRLLPRDTPPWRPPKKPKGRPSTTADLEDFVVALAQVFTDAGGKPAYYVKNPFWQGIEVIKRELKHAFAPEVSGLAGLAEEAKWFTRLEGKISGSSAEIS